MSAPAGGAALPGGVGAGFKPAPTSATTRVWRLLLDFDRPGACHMATDEALHACFTPGRDRPILRLYSWSPPCLSLGYAQPVGEIDREACARAGVDLVRRPSGGRAVLHDRELTYAVVAAIDDPAIGGGVGRSYLAVAAGLLAGLRALGVAAALAPGSPAGDAAARRSGACFAAAARHELLWQGRKLVGSAQLRRDGVLLQHGSILLDRSEISLAALLSAPRAETLARHLALTSATVAEATGARLDPPSAAEGVAAGFVAALGLTLVPDDLTTAERALADAALAERYATAAWTERR
jgi:lipoate-protein ligase A